MKIEIAPPKNRWKEILQRPYANQSGVYNAVQHILNEVKIKGDEALRSFALQFDKVALKELKVTPEEMRKAADEVPAELKTAIEQAAANIEKFHSAQLVNPEPVATMPGVSCWRRSVGIQKVGLYVPGGTAPLFSTVLMLGIPAKLAGCQQVILCTPCNAHGSVPAAVLHCAQRAGITEVFKIGGAQAIAAMAFGTSSIPAVYKIFGPGNQYVTAAKQLVQMAGVAIDMPAGPSEVCVFADETAVPDFVASDLLSQAEHGADSQVLLVCHSEDFVSKCLAALQQQLQTLPRKAIASKALEQSVAVVVANVAEAVELINNYAPEHLILSCSNADMVAQKIVNAGSVFIGNYAPESAGDYASGTNHTLPTNGFARAYSGVSVDSFVKKITYQKLSKQGLVAIGPTVIAMAEAEGLQAHANAVKIRQALLPPNG